MPLSQMIPHTEVFVQNRTCTHELFSKVSKILFVIFTAAILNCFLNNIIRALKLYIDIFSGFIQHNNIIINTKDVFLR